MDSLLRFESTIKSEVTKQNYKRNLDSFKKYIGAKDYDSILSIPKDNLQDSVEEYLIHLKKTKNPNSIKALFFGVKHFFVMNRISLDWEIISKMFPETRKTTGDKAWNTKHIQKILDSTKSKRNRALIHFMASTGCRIGVLDHELIMKNLFDADSGCKGVVFYSGFKDEYYSFLTPEAVTSLEEYHSQRKHDGEIFDEDTPIFRLDYSIGSQPVKPLSSMTAKKITERIIKSSGIKRKKNGFTSEIQQNHGFRKRFNTILKIAGVNWNIAEKLMGHKVGLDGVYFKPTREECFKEFHKAITELSIDDAVRLEEEIKARDVKIQELETDQDRKIMNLEFIVAELSKRLETKL
jgi:site-specific recombinase XerD